MSILTVLQVSQAYSGPHNVMAPLPSRMLGDGRYKAWFSVRVRFVCWCVGMFAFMCFFFGICFFFRFSARVLPLLLLCLLLLLLWLLLLLLQLSSLLRLLLLLLLLLLWLVLSSSSSGSSSASPTCH